MTKSHLLRCLTLLAVLVTVSAGGLLREAAAEPIDWKDAASGDFDLGTNWIGDAVPDDTDDAIFNAGGFYDVIFNADQTTLSFQILGDEV